MITPAQMLMVNKEADTKLRQGQPPRRYSETMNRQTALDKSEIFAIMKIEKGIADKRLARLIQAK